MSQAKGVDELPLVSTVSLGDKRRSKASLPTPPRGTHKCPSLPKGEGDGNWTQCLRVHSHQRKNTLPAPKALLKSALRSLRKHRGCTCAGSRGRTGETEAVPALVARRRETEPSFIGWEAPDQCHFGRVPMMGWKEHVWELCC
ncbi:hypothetical protein AAFF_G00045920 [Aldrovandia affinis]|uniref:Uncharacterized protein n=1 Tax=Aldrovandia affinis TaxID=143900 RepID=A0AAD7S1S3_9TELE|nr:hypothetical protein AAFF_G00045920 [Aldrovandia affinis]